MEKEKIIAFRQREQHYAKVISSGIAKFEDLWAFQLVETEEQNSKMKLEEYMNPDYWELYMLWVYILTPKQWGRGVVVVRSNAALWREGFWF